MTIWTRWLKIAEVVGIVNMMILLSLIYLLLLAPMAIVLKLVSDPLRLKKPNIITWIIQQKFSDDIGKSMKNQF